MILPITVLYPRPWGEGMRCAHLMAGRLAREGHLVLAQELTRYLASNLHADQVVLVCLESGREQPETVLDFLDYVDSLASGDLRRLRYSVFNSGEDHRPTSVGVELDFLLKRRGGTRIVPLRQGLADSGIEFPLWSDAVSEILIFDRILRFPPVPLEL